ncbi:hypothetical protein A2765_02025 [Candidatus Kaiserbacteria bacterium RIFCSPHIGHO2_01_FULL_56_24]|uniref:PKD domain-containing protein n=1 Tax=Candidatus Kaiserbacteria bacterium RIFCSPHIGHO2_01_FULL_56_24 TaxID=1798487 RepID=A0A1F6DAM1_9BACT|nr:MAG: hypothetical protein A2765_02025 [Candidatus Kaiserbacteria bacterium RIFCSPHIGHO2_01_FULL_56_24]
MKKNVFAGIFVAMLCIAPFAASALTVDDVQARIRELLAKVAELTAQIRALQSQATVTTPSGTTPPAYGLTYRVCNILEHSIAQGQTNDDVKSLQEFLKERGYLNAEASGYFGALTKEALIRFQASEGVVAAADVRATGAGLFGPKTKERLRIWCGLPGQGGSGIPGQQFTASPTRGNAPLSVTFSTWLSGFRINTIFYTLDYGDGSSERAADCYAPADACQSPGQNTHTYSSNGTYTATLNRITDPCPDDGNPNTPRCLAAIHSEVIGKLQIIVGPIACTKEYRPVCGLKPIVCITTPCNPVPTTYGNTCMMQADGATYTYDGQCRTQTTDPSSDPQCKSWYDGCNSCGRSTSGGPAACTLKYCSAESMTVPYCTGYFGDSTNKSPTISGFSGPTTLKANETGTWTVKASDPEGQQLSYYISWGDEADYTASGLMTTLPVFTQTTTFTHAYSGAGTYAVHITARDSAGKEASVTITVRVSGSSGTVCSAQYEPVCGRPTGCANTCATGAQCSMICQLYDPLTYSNRCYLDAAGAEYLYGGACTQ